jgi:hypothetical protein
MGQTIILLKSFLYFYIFFFKQHESPNELVLILPHLMNWETEPQDGAGASVDNSYVFYLTNIKFNL